MGHERTETLATFCFTTKIYPKNFCYGTTDVDSSNNCFFAGFVVALVVVIVAVTGKINMFALQDDSK